MLPPCVLWIDPGGDTGLAWLWLEDGTRKFWATEYPFAEACQAIEDTCRLYGPALFVGWETYQVRAGEPQHNARDAIEPIGMARWCAIKHGCHILQEAARHTPDRDDQEWLRAAGWWVPGKDDAQSAAAHMRRWLLRSGQMPPEVTDKVSAAVATMTARHRRQKT